jgi:hypothetical protein
VIKIIDNTPIRIIDVDVVDIGVFADPPVLGVPDASGAGFEGGRAVLEGLLLPAVEHRGVHAVLVTQF